MRHLRLSVPCLLALALLGCGDADPTVPDHGLASRELASTPAGEAVTVGRLPADGARYVALLSITNQASKKGREGGLEKDETLERRATVEHTWTIHRPPHGAPPTSSIGLRYTAAEGHRAEDVLAQEVVTGRLAHDARGRPIPASLQLAGGTKSEQLEVQDRLGSLLLAGYGGAPSWLPPRPIQAGEAWPLEQLLDLRAVRNLRARARELGLSNPEPLFKGTARFKRVVDGLLEVELDALIELKGTLRDASGRARALSSGDRFRGLAFIDPATGVPARFDVTHVHREHHAAGTEQVSIRATVTVRGTVTRTDGGR